MRPYSFWVYIVASGPCGYLYVGMTNDLARRIDEHRHGQVDGYSRERGTDRLVWHERHQYVDQAILREKRIKRWRRPWKFALIEAANPHWADLYPQLLRAQAARAKVGDERAAAPPGGQSSMRFGGASSCA